VPAVTSDGRTAASGNPAERVAPAAVVAVIAPFIGRWFFARVLSGIEAVLSGSDSEVLLFSTGDVTGPHRAPAHRRLRRRADAMLVVGLAADSPQLEQLLDVGLPVVLVGAHVDGASSVAIDDVQGGRLATQHLVDLGHERIGLISGRSLASPLYPEHDRFAGYRAALAASGIAFDARLHSLGHFDVEGAEHAMAALLAQREPPTAVFAMSDEMGYGALRALRRHGLRPGRDVSVVGFDGHDMADMFDLTTVEQPVEELGAVATRCLIDQLDGVRGEPVVVRLPTQLQVRASTGPCADRR